MPAWSSWSPWFINGSIISLSYQINLEFAQIASDNLSGQLPKVYLQSTSFGWKEISIGYISWSDRPSLGWVRLVSKHFHIKVVEVFHSLSNLWRKLCKHPPSHLSQERIRYDTCVFQLTRRQCMQTCCMLSPTWLCSRCTFLSLSPSFLVAHIPNTFVLFSPTCSCEDNPHRRSPSSRSRCSWESKTSRGCSENSSAGWFDNIRSRYNRQFFPALALSESPAAVGVV